MKIDLSIKQTEIREDIQKRKRLRSTLNDLHSLEFFLSFSLPTEQFPSCHETSHIIHTGALLNYTEDIYNMGPYCENILEIKRVTLVPQPFQPQQTSHLLDLISSQPWSYFKEQKTLQQTTSKCPFLDYISLVLVFLGSPTTLLSTNLGKMNLRKYTFSSSWSFYLISCP